MILTPQLINQNPFFHFKHLFMYFQFLGVIAATINAAAAVHFVCCAVVQQSAASWVGTLMWQQSKCEPGYFAAPSAVLDFCPKVKPSS